MPKPAARETAQDNRCFDESFLADCDKRIRQAYFFWRRKCRDGRLPSRHDIDPVEILGILPYVMLVDVVQPGPQFIYRLVGASEKRHRGVDPTGKTLEEAFSGLDERYCDGNYRYVASSARHLFDNTPEPAAQGGLVDAETLFMPLADDGRTVGTIMVCGVTKPQKNAREPIALKRGKG